MKKIGLFLSVSAMLFATSCADKEAYTITGTVSGDDVNGKEIYLQQLNEDGRGFTALDTAKIENGTFSFKGKASELPEVRFLTIADAPAKIARPVLFILERGDIKVTLDSLSTVEGTSMNESYQRFANDRDEINAKLRSVGMKYGELNAKGELTPEAEEKLNQEFDGYSNEMSGVLFEYTKANMNNPIGEFFFKTAGSTLGEDKIKELLALASPKFKEDKQVQELEKYLQALENTAIGKMFVDLKGKTPEGKDIALSEYAGKGKVVLIDFWASWCGPCIREMPKVIEAYKKYKAKGFEIVGVSLDQDNEAWTKSIKDLGITWPQMSDLKAWQSDLSGAYGVRSIPHTVLLDKDGKIVMKDLRGDKIAEELEKLLK